MVETTTTRNSRNWLLLWLLLGTLLLSAGLNFYLLCQGPEYAVSYESEAGLEASVTEVELQRTRQELAACQAAHYPSDTARTASAPVPASF